MIWKQCTFRTKTKVAEDVLGNPIYEWADGESTVARHTPWTDQQVALIGREVTMNQQKFLVCLPYSAVRTYERVVLDNVLYEITESKDLGPRYSLIQVKVYKL